MRARFLALAACCLALPGVSAEEPPRRPSRLAEAQARARAAFEAGDEAALAALAGELGNGIWSAADELVAAGHVDPAVALAKASRHPDRERLQAYLEVEGGLAPDEKARGAVRRADEAFGRRDFAAALAALEGVAGRGIVGLHVLNGRALAQEQLGMREEALATLTERLAHAERIGCTPAVASALDRSAALAAERGDLSAYRDLMGRLIEVLRRLEDRVRLAGALIDLGSMLDGPEETEQGRALLVEGIAAARAAGHKAFLANGLVNLGHLLAAEGEPEAARTAYEEGLSLQEEVGNAPYAARARAGLGRLAAAAGDGPRALDLFAQAFEAVEREGDAEGALDALRGMLAVFETSGDDGDGVPWAERAVRVAESARRPGAVVRAEVELGTVLARAGRTEEGLAALERAQTTARSSGRPADLALALARLGSVRADLADYGGAEAAAREALALAEREGSRSLQRTARTLLGNVRGRLGDGEGAVIHHGWVRDSFADEPPSRDHARSLANLGYAHLMRGDTADSLAWSLRAREMYLGLGDRRMATEVLANVGGVYLRLGDLDRAQEVLETVAREAGEAGDPSGQATALINLGVGFLGSDAPDRAREPIERGLALARSAGLRLWEHNALANLAVLEGIEGRTPQARALWEQALEMARSLGLPTESAMALGSLAQFDLAEGALDRALARAAEALALAEAQDDPLARAAAAADLAQVHLARGEHAAVLPLVRDGSDALAGALEGIPTTLGVSASGVSEDLAASGLEAASAVGDPAAALEFVERGRAAQLLEWLGGRESLSRVAADPALVESERARRGEVLAARARLARLKTRGARGEFGEARDALARAEAAHLEAVGRLQLEARGAAAVAFPKAATLAEVQEALGDDAALVVYAEDRERLVALVVTRSEARLAPLFAREGAEERIAEWVAPLREPGGEEGTTALAAARAALIEPLALPAAVRRVLVVPDRGLAHLPFGALLPGRSVGQVASATAWRLLAAQRPPPGARVLALGDPRYAPASRLAPLPSTREEAAAVGDLTLLGPDATESRLVAALADRRWRALHLACHGLIQEERPMMSALALTAGPDDDGLLQVAEVYALRIPADLVVLSACESGKGRIYGGAGVVGFTSAFLIAGASTVICSLWKVDDEATRALMTEFYAAWNPKDGGPGVGVAEALRLAQERVAAQERWRHPYYWAAWAAWGLP